MTNLEIARLLRQIAAAYTILGENRFKIIAYENAATAIEHATSEMQDLWEEQKLDTIPGLGTSITAHLDEIFKTGHSKHFDEILKKINPKIFPLLEVPGIGPKKALEIVKTGKIPKYLEANIKRYKKGNVKEKRIDLPTADKIANEIIKYLRDMGDLGDMEINKLGSLRRQVSTIGDIDISIATNNPEKIINQFVKYPGKIIERGPTGASILLSSGTQVDLRVSKPEEYGAMLQYFTGSKYHNIKLREFAQKKGYSVSEYGIKSLKSLKVQKFKTEKDFYEFLGLDYIPPELREAAGEIEAALEHRLPKLVELSDIKGDLHMHASFAQGTSHDSGENTIGEMREIGEMRGYEYIAITDHNPSLSGHNSDQIISEMQRRKKYFDDMGTKSVRVINMLEVDILPNGDLSVPNEGLEYLDGCLVSIHSSFNMNKEEMTKRVLSGLSNPVARIFAHPTGRLLGKRDGYDLDWDQIFKVCLEHNKALEINCSPNRLDLPDTLVREAIKHGVKITIGTDAHIKDDLGLMKYGVSVARRGWAQKQDILNTLSFDEIIKWIKLRT